MRVREEGEYFGEQAFIQSKHRSAGVFAVEGDVLLLRMDATAFKQHLESRLSAQFSQRIGSYRNDLERASSREDLESQTTIHRATATSAV